VKQAWLEAAKETDTAFQFRDGHSLVLDKGFAVDMDAMEGRLTPKYSGNMYSEM